LHVCLLPDRIASSQAYFNLCLVIATKIFAHQELEEKLEAEDQSIIKMKDEMDFFTLIENKLEQQGFEVLETLPPDDNSRDKSNAIFSYRSAGHIS
jgi:hypothetical protein